MVVKPLIPNRNQLVAALNDNSRVVKAFEDLFAQVGVGLPEEFASLVNDVDAVDLQASYQQQQAQELIVPFLEFSRYENVEGGRGKLWWNADEDTLNLGHDGGVTMQLGLETYAYVENITGAQLDNKTVVTFDDNPAATRLAAKEFLADGSMMASQMIGVMTQDVPNGEAGRATVFGQVRGIDTTGAPFSEAWAVGDVLYASTTISGGLTKNKPTSPNVVVIVGYVTKVGAADGEIFVRPILQNRKLSGSFGKTTSITPSAINTADAILMDTTLDSTGISLGTPASRIVVDDSGLYSVTLEAQITSNSSSSKDVWLWLRKNGVDVTSSASIITVSASNDYFPIAKVLTLALDAGDYVEAYWAADSTNVTLDAVASTAFAPAAPAILINIVQTQL